MTTPGPPPYGAYPPQYDPYGYARPRPTNGMAIASLICAFLFAPLGIIFGHISLSQIKRTGEDGHGLAIAGLVISYLITIAGIFVMIGVILFAIVFARSVNEHLDELNSQYPNYTAAPQTPGNQLPDFDPPANVGANCAYPATTEPATKPNKPPRSGRVPTDPARVSVSMSTDRRQHRPATRQRQGAVHRQQFRQPGAAGLLRRHDVSPADHFVGAGRAAVRRSVGHGTGGPGYRFANEYPTNQYRLADPALQTPVVYPRGTVAMANAGRAPTAASSSSSMPTRCCRRPTRPLARSTRPGWRRWKRSPPRESTTGATTGSRRWM